MHFLNTLTCTLAGAAFASAVSAPDASLQAREESALGEAAQRSIRQRSAEPEIKLTTKRRGGGSGGGGSRGGGSTSGSTTGSTTGSTSSGSRGGKTRPKLPKLPKSPKRPKGSRKFGNSQFLPGGSVASYRSGQTSPSGITPFRVPTAARAAAIFPGAWGAGAFVYSYTLDNDDLDDTELDDSFVDDLEDQVPVRCLCEEFLACSCEQENDQDYLGFLIDDEDVDDLDETVVAFNDVNGTMTLVINGTLSNETSSSSDLLDDDTPRGTPANSDAEPQSAGIKQAAVQLSGWSLVTGVVVFMVMAM